MPLWDDMRKVRDICYQLRNFCKLAGLDKNSPDYDRTWERRMNLHRELKRLIDARAGIVSSPEEKNESK